jgi:hypothetical protein
MKIRSAVAALAIAAFGASAAHAAGTESTYTTIDLENGCLLLTPPEEIEEAQGAEFVCPGHAGLVVWVGEGDLRFFLGYGPRGRRQCSYGQTIAAFNTIGTTLEWRLRDEAGRMRPFATILRYTVDFDGNEAQYLVVTRLDGDTACHMAYVKASEPDHNALARQAADAYAPAFRCGVDEAFNVTSAGIDYGDRPGTPPRCPRE